MSRVFVDTSAIFSLLTPEDQLHERAKRSFAELMDRSDRLLTSSYVLVETHALLGRRLGIAASEQFREQFEPLLEVFWIDRELHEKGLDLLLARRKRGLSLVDTTSFVLLKEHCIDRAFAYDRHFEAEGVNTI